jgi:alginate O-acetyltransferase complex protein AlgI
MLFHDGIFLIFILAVILLTSLARGRRSRIWVLLVASYVFYAAWDWRFLGLIVLSTAVDYFIGLALERTQEAQRRKRLLIASLVVNLGLLGVFKYLDFFVDSFNAAFGGAIPMPGLTLPVGISFFTFQSMSYTIDIYRRELQPKRSPVEFALFVAFFPQLVAGPIIRARDFLGQMDVALERFPNRIKRAIPLFCLGLFKKVAVADNLALVADKVFADPAAVGGLDRWLGALAFTGQIYCDFSGYTDMALALCALFGFTFPLNFRAPYLSLGPQGFWRRWHISLSSWLRDYLYIPLGGSRYGVRRMYVALTMTMVLGGIWHGAAWTFVLWGTYHGVLLVAERLLAPRVPGFDSHAGKAVRWPLFFLLTVIGWIIFRADSMASLWVMLAGLGDLESPATVAWRIVVAGGLFVALEHVLGELDRQRDGQITASDVLTFAGAGVLLLGALILKPTTSVPFIYFQF